MSQYETIPQNKYQEKQILDNNPENEPMFDSVLDLIKLAFMGIVAVVVLGCSIIPAVYVSTLPSVAEYGGIAQVAAAIVTWIVSAVVIGWFLGLTK